MTARRDAHAVLLPALDSRTLPTWAEDFLRAGGRTLLLGESREEYVARRMSEQTPAHRAAGALHRAHRPGRRGGRCAGVGRGGPGAGRHPTPARAGPRPSGRRDSPRHAGRRPGRGGTGDRRGRAAARGRHGVLATAKHFPGYRALAADPALADTTLAGNAAELEPGLAPFRAAIEAGVGAVMLGPAVVTALDRHQPASTSPTVVRLLREELGFTGLVVTDDVDAPATHRGRSVPGTAIAALAAGADLVLLAVGPELGVVAEQIEAAVADGRLTGERLSEAAERVRRHAHRPTPPGVPPGWRRAQERSLGSARG